jgi:hypothetical protein
MTELKKARFKVGISATRRCQRAQQNGTVHVVFDDGEVVPKSTILAAKIKPADQPQPKKPVQLALACKVDG